MDSKEAIPMPLTRIITFDFEGNLKVGKILLKDT